MKSFLHLNLLVGLIFILAETNSDVIYHVSPTEPLSSCSWYSSCPPHQLCHYLAEHSSEFFSADHINVTLIFMCGIHNYSKDLTAQNLNSFIIQGAAESRENIIIINHQFSSRNGTSKSSCTIIQFLNISLVNIINLTMMCPSLNIMNSFITVKNSNLYGYSGIKEILSFITITGKGSQALLDN